MHYYINMTQLIIFAVILLLVLLFLYKSGKLTEKLTDPGGELVYESVPTSAFYQYDSKPLYGSYA